ncbi:MAG: TraB/GumN family protein [Bacteroidota bacterium]
MRRLFLLLIAFAASPSFGQSIAAPDLQAPDTTATPLMLWTLADEDNTVHLLGSVHFARPDLFPLAAPIEAAYDRAEVVVLEIDPAEMQAESVSLMQRGIFPDTTTLAHVLPDSLYARTLAAVQPLGLPEIAVAKMEPWMLSILVTTASLSNAGFGAGIDQHYYERAVADEKTVHALETAAFQIGMFDTMPMASQVDYLRVTLDDQADTAAMLDSMTDAWLSGDTAGLDVFMNESFAEFPELEAVVLTDRNAAWVPQVEALLDGSEDALVVVGAAHLVGDNSVVTMLRDEGYTVTQVSDIQASPAQD